MCTEPLYAIRLKTEFDKKFQKFGVRSQIKVLCAVKKIGKNISLLNVDNEHYDLLMISCGQCMQCRINRVKQRAVMCMCESLEHKDNSFITLTFGYPQTYSYYRHEKGLSHYLASKKAHFHEWSLDVETFQKFMKRLRTWYYNYQLTDYLIKHNYNDFVYKKCFNKYTGVEYYKVKSHIRIPADLKDEVLKDFHPKKIRFMHCGEYGSKNTCRAHHHVILHGFQFPDIEPIHEKGQTYYISKILSDLWPFGIHRIGKCEYNSCCYVARYVTKKLNGVNGLSFYNGRKPEYATYSTKPVLGSSYFNKNYKEFANTGIVSVVTDKLYECPIPKSYDNILKKIDIDLYNNVKERRVKDCKKDLDELLKQDRSIYSKLDSNEKNCMSTLRKLVRVFESEENPNIDEYLKKAKSFGISTKYFISEFKDNAISYLNKKTFKDHKSKSSNYDLHRDYYRFELARKRSISDCMNRGVHLEDEFLDAINKRIEFYKAMPNPFRLPYCRKRGRSLPDIESINENSGIDEKGKEYILNVL